METKCTNPKDVVGIRKAPMSTVPENVIAELGVAMLEGALKYGRHNYREAGVRASVYYDATRRHLGAWWEGEDLDPDSGVSHVTKAIATLVVLRDAMMQGMVEDDRPPKSKPFYADLNARAADLVDKYGDRDVKHHVAKSEAPSEDWLAAQKAMALGGNLPNEVVHVREYPTWGKVNDHWYDSPRYGRVYLGSTPK